jgi:eukaryotic-like serine/threonine-protein kinase
MTRSIRLAAALQMSAAQTAPQPPGLAIGRYVLYAPIASGGMASVHVGRMRGPSGFSRTVAVKRLHPQFARDPSFVAMLMDEARLAARITHPNVVSVLDVVQTDGELFLVMDFIRGEALGKLARALRARREVVPPPIAVAILCNALHGLHAAHEVKDENGELLEIVHRDVSPQNVLVGVDGVARIVDFGVAKAGHRLQTTQAGELKGKLDYMAPEQIEQKDVTRKVDIYAASVVLWEILAGRRLIDGGDVGSRLMQTLKGGFLRPSALCPTIGQGLDAVVMRGLARDPAERWPTARQMALELEKVVVPATASTVGAWALSIAGEAIAKRDRIVAEVETISQRVACPRPLPPATGEGQRDSAGWPIAPAGAHSEVRMHTAPDLLAAEPPGELPVRERVTVRPPSTPAKARASGRARTALLLFLLLPPVLAVLSTRAGRAPQPLLLLSAAAPMTAVHVAAPAAPPALETTDAQTTASERVEPAAPRPPARKTEVSKRTEWSRLTRH